ncbi:unnamed protein product [Clonostachys rosea f. rosea IK726]|uniref:Uncharacterized protein n=1 Tax=Clonostachys rosea f. rosea IK726 TaxID=1349383 RepID=A0ACA9T8W5_BIOOC|nr:unnamed protein product [Clonostachys rosea f. rosea IK726]
MSSISPSIQLARANKMRKPISTIGPCPRSKPCKRSPDPSCRYEWCKDSGVGGENWDDMAHFVGPTSFIIPYEMQPADDESFVLADPARAHGPEL